MISTAFHSPISFHKIEQVKGKIGIVIKMKGCKASSDLKSYIKKLYNNIIVYRNPLNKRL